jgi:hypothetical protein
MIINVEEVVYIYIGVCISMLIFNVFIIFYRKAQYKKFKIRTQDISRLVNQQLDHIVRNEPLEQEVQIRLSNMLSNTNKLMAFHEAIEEASKRDDSVVQEYLIMSRQVFETLAVKYMQQDNMKKAYFAYLMSKYKVCQNLEQNVIIDAMLELIVTKSAYCRENALKALYSFGNEKNVLSALILINEKHIFHHEKLLTDGLLSFEGDKKLLGDLLWKHFDQFHSEIQVSIVKYMHAVSDQYKEEFYSLLMKKETNKEVTIALIRYFWKYDYEPAQKLLYRKLTEEVHDWEIIAISASAIRTYPCRETVEALKKALHHSNWYVRYNAAESLNSLHKDYNELASIYNGTDRFARDMLLYQDQRVRIKEETKREVLKP